VPFPVAQEICQFPGRASGAHLQVTAGPRQVDGPGQSAARIYELDFVGKVLAKRALLGQISKVLSVMIVVLDLATVVSLFVATLVILTSINLSVLENERDFGTLQALGYGRRLIAKIILTEASTYAVGAVLVSIPIAIALSVYINDRMGAAWIQVHNTFRTSVFANVLLPALALIPLGSYPGIRHVVSRAALASIRSRILE
jgi:ABC-type antimicrobial peptide transport system permease subunit